jgi:ATP-dependent DNA helicase RecG
VRAEIEAGRQVFFICPLVEDSEAVEAKSAVAEFERLSTEVFPDLADRMRLLHGRMATAEKDAAMEAFRSGEAAILVSTSVIEVGVDVPNASVMVIEGADRFGLAQLHQFRGRVGRSDQQSYCYVLSESDSEAAQSRLALLETTTDGFELAEADLRMRGPGEYFGTRQSGLPDLRVAKLTDQVLLLKARNFAERMLDRDPNLRAPEHQPLAQAAGQLAVEGAEAVH